jgi:ribokinase
MNKAAAKGMKIALNPSPLADNLVELPLNRVSYFILNEIEGKELTDKEGPEEIIKELRRMYPDSTVMLTLGSRGAIYDDGVISCAHDVFDVKAVDTTAAGDTFTGYFLNAITTGMSPEQSLRIASKASAIAVSRMGAAPSIPTRIEVMETELQIKNSRRVPI